MSSETPAPAAHRHFIQQIIDADLAAGKHASIATRFPPEPNGYLHVGHAKSICLNFGLAQEFGGQCNLRFDDTNPTKEDVEYVDSIQEDISWLGWEWSGEVHYASDYFDTLYEWAVHLIENGKANILHAKFFLALSFPQLSMTEFMKIMSVPGNIEDAFKADFK